MMERFMQRLERLEWLVDFLKSRGGGSSVALYSAENADTVVITSTDAATPTEIASVSGVTVAAGQKVVVTGSVNFSGSGAGSFPQMTISVDGTVVDTVTDLHVIGGEGTTTPEVTTRTVTLTGLSAGAHVISLGAASPDGSGNVVVGGPSGGQKSLGQLSILVA